jgi:hypothetical protein
MPSYQMYRRKFPRSEMLLSVPVLRIILNMRRAYRARQCTSSLPKANWRASATLVKKCLVYNQVVLNIYIWRSGHPRARRGSRSRA